MRAVYIHGPGDVRVGEVDRPQVGSKDVLVKVEACGICGSDITFARNGFLRDKGEPWPLGHEAAGTVVAAGNDAKFSLGTRVAVNPMGDPGNVIGNGGAEGAFADYLLVRNAEDGRHLLRLPDGLSAERAALIEPLAVSLHGINQARLDPGDKVVVFGAGPIGLGAVYWLARRGVTDIAVVDLSEARLERARLLGAHHPINPGKSDLKAELIRIHGEGPPMFGSPTVGSDVFFDMAGASTLLQQTIGFGKYQSRIVLTAAYPAPVPLDLQSLLIREIAITPAVGYPTELGNVLTTLLENDERLDHYVSHRFSFDDFPTAFATAEDRSSAKVVVVFD